MIAFKTAREREVKKMVTHPIAKFVATGAQSSNSSSGELGMEALWRRGKPGKDRMGVEGGAGKKIHEALTQIWEWSWRFYHQDACIGIH